MGLRPGLLRLPGKPAAMPVILRVERPAALSTTSPGAGLGEERDGPETVPVKGGQEVAGQKEGTFVRRNHRYAPQHAQAATIFPDATITDLNGYQLLGEELGRGKLKKKKAYFTPLP